MKLVFGLVLLEWISLFIDGDNWFKSNLIEEGNLSVEYCTSSVALKGSINSIGFPILFLFLMSL